MLVLLCRYIEKDAALERRFQPVTIEEPTLPQTLQILQVIYVRLLMYRSAQYKHFPNSLPIKLQQPYVIQK
jgi:ATP-dependent Clp protease ATP-binding subunit ClpA